MKPPRGWDSYIVPFNPSSDLAENPYEAGEIGARLVATLAVDRTKPGARAFIHDMVMVRNVCQPVLYGLTVMASCAPNQASTYGDTNQMNLAVIENAGYVGENLRKSGFTNWRDAEAYINAHYDEDEREMLHVDIAHWDEDGGFWSYDH